MSYGILMTVRGVLPGDAVKRLLSERNGQLLTFETLEEAQAASQELARRSGAEFKPVPLGWAEEHWKAGR